MYDKLNADELDKMVQNIYELETSLKDNNLDVNSDKKREVIRNILDCMSAYLQYKTAYYLKEADDKAREVRLG